MPRGHYTRKPRTKKFVPPLEPEPAVALPPVPKHRWVPSPSIIPKSGDMFAYLQHPCKECPPGRRATYFNKVHTVDY